MPRPLAGFFIAGESDVCLNLAQDIADGINGAKYILMAEAGHVHAVERPDAVNEVLGEHLLAVGL